MSISLAFLPETDTKRSDDAAGGFLRLARALVEARQRRAEARVALAVQASGHAGVLADFERARSR